MIRLPPNTPPTAPRTDERAGGARGDADPTRDPFKRRDPRDGGLRGRLGRDGGTGAGGDPFDRSSDRSGAFDRRMQDAMSQGHLGQGGRDHGGSDRGGTDKGQSEGRESEGREERTRVLAVAEASPDIRPALSALFAPPPAPGAAPAAMPAVPAPATSTTESAVAAILTQVEAAYRADLAAATGTATTLRVPLDGLVEGLRDVVVHVEGDRLDVTLTRTADAALLDLGAAQALANRLQARFAKRTVRILEAVETARNDRSADASPFAVGALFGRSTK